eukprot:m.151542 g.151542  ORF g.151542 m.151542 type:complete len:103 (+) comp52829_c0_seq1:3-311(+)
MALSRAAVFLPFICPSIFFILAEGRASSPSHRNTEPDVSFSAFSLRISHGAISEAGGEVDGDHLKVGEHFTIQDRAVESVPAFNGALRRVHLVRPDIETAAQ